MTSSGKVWLVGAGPGDPGLITVRGAQLLAEADLVLYDGLVNPLLLRLARGQCERTARVRRETQAIVPQADINERLIHEARLGKQVVRLKGGDPYVFGRGSEEAAALHAAGIPFEVVPGITAATAAAVYAGISCTHRDIASAVAFVTGHEDPARDEPRLDFNALARFPGTLVFYMALSRLPDVCSRLLQGGLAPSTPAAVVCHASLPSQQVIEGQLQTIAQLIRQTPPRPPSLLILGECVRQRSQLSWFELLPLFGRSIGITRPEDQATDAADLVVRLGGEAVSMPLIEIAPVDSQQAARIRDCLERLSRYQWIIWTSSNGVSEFFRHLQMAGCDARALAGIQLACVGDATARRLHEFGLNADLVPTVFRAETLAAELIPRITGPAPLLWARASRGRDVLPDLLRNADIPLEQLVVYENRDVPAITPDVLERLHTGTLHWITLTSPAAARRVAELLLSADIQPGRLKTRFASISPLTSAAARSAGLEIHAEATVAEWPRLLDAIATAPARTPETDQSPRD
ncbi:MAG: uroporphyrinogen-III C-methyltransferase [Planctomycetota bacterium]